MDKIRDIYSADNDNDMINVILDTYRKMQSEYSAQAKEIDELERFIANAEEGTYICNDPKRDRLKAYLVSQYGEDVV